MAKFLRALKFGQKKSNSDDSNKLDKKSDCSDSIKKDKNRAKEDDRNTSFTSMSIYMGRSGTNETDDKRKKAVVEILDDYCDPADLRQEIAGDFESASRCESANVSTDAIYANQGVIVADDNYAEPYVEKDRSDRILNRNTPNDDSLTNQVATISNPSTLNHHISTIHSQQTDTRPQEEYDDPWEFKTSLSKFDNIKRTVSNLSETQPAARGSIRRLPNSKSLQNFKSSTTVVAITDEKELSASGNLSTSTTVLKSKLVQEQDKRFLLNRAKRCASFDLHSKPPLFELRRGREESRKPESREGSSNSLSAMSVASGKQPRQLYETAFDSKVVPSGKDLEEIDRVTNHPVMRTCSSRTSSRTSSPLSSSQSSPKLSVGISVARDQSVLSLFSQANEKQKIKEVVTSVGKKSPKATEQEKSIITELESKFKDGGLKEKEVNNAIINKKKEGMVNFRIEQIKALIHDPPRSTNCTPELLHKLRQAGSGTSSAWSTPIHYTSASKVNMDIPVRQFSDLTLGTNNNNCNRTRNRMSTSKTMGDFPNCGSKEESNGGKKIDSQDSLDANKITQKPVRPTLLNLKGRSLDLPSDSKKNQSFSLAEKPKHNCDKIGATVLEEDCTSERLKTEAMDVDSVDGSIQKQVKTPTGLKSLKSPTENSNKRLQSCASPVKTQDCAPAQLAPKPDTPTDIRPKQDYDPPWDVLKKPRLSFNSQRKNLFLPIPSIGPGPEAEPKPATTPTTPSSDKGLPEEALEADEPMDVNQGGGVAGEASQPDMATGCAAMSNQGAVQKAVRPTSLFGDASKPSRTGLTLNVGGMTTIPPAPKRARHVNLSLNFGVVTVAEKVEPLLPLERQGWYHGNISRVDAENVLRSSGEGSYLVRNSESSKSDYSLSLKSSRGFMHMKIVNSGGKFILGQFSKPFASIPEMVHHYSLNRLPIRGAEHMSLLHPVIEQLL